jgi:putative FmdB family regulatory protein
MPAYDFRCTACKKTFEVTRPMGASEKEKCPSCGGEAKKVFSPVGVSFKGSGFHNTDYRPAPKEEKAPDETAPCAAKKDDNAACSQCPAAN